MKTLKSQIVQLIPLDYFISLIILIKYISLFNFGNKNLKLQLLKNFSYLTIFFKYLT